MKTVLITGGIGSGKSAVCSLLSEKGIPIYDTDSRAKQLYYTDATLVRQLEDQFEISIFDTEGKLNKKIISDLIFSDEDNRKRFESLIHPAVLRDFKSWKSDQEIYARQQGLDIPFVCVESAIALDKPLFKDIFDQVWIVDAPIGLRVERAASRDVTSKEKIRQRIACQQVHLDQADQVIVNDGDWETLRRKVDQAIEILNL